MERINIIFVVKLSLMEDIMLEETLKFRSLRIKTIITLLILLLTLLLTIYFVVGSISKEQIEKIENQDVTQKVSMAIDALEVYEMAIVASASDWGPWDDTYRFVQDGNEEFIASNLQPETFFNLNLDILAFVNSSGDYVFAKELDKETLELRPVPDELSQILDESKIRCSINPDATIQGIAAMPEGPMLMASYPIVTSSYEGPVRGQVIMGSYIDKELIDAMSQRLKMMISLEYADSESLEFTENLESRNSTDFTEIIAVDDEKISGSRRINDMLGQPVLQLGVLTNRDYHKIGLNGINTMIMALFVAGLVFTAAILFFMEKNILKRLATLNRGILEIGKSGKVKKRLENKTSCDEIFTLTDEINHMLNRIEASELQIRESEELYRAFVEKGTEVIYSLDKDGRFSYISPNCLSVFGNAPEAFIGKAFVSFLLPDEREGWLKYLEHISIKSANNGEKDSYQYQARSSNGWWKWFHTNLSRTPFEKPDIVYQGIIFDIHRLKIAEEALKISNEALEARVNERTLDLTMSNRMLKTEINERRKIQEEITNLAYHDHLTGLPNRLLLAERLEQAILLAGRIEKHIGVVFIDLDNFKIINDTMGHAVGDELLKLVAGRLKEAVRRDDTVSRLGGDEFILMVQNVVDLDDIIIILEKIHCCFKSNFTLKNQEVKVNASIGVSVYPNDGKDVESLIKNADLAMYEAKNEGKNRYAICNLPMRNKVGELATLTNDLYKALEQDELMIHYQPQLSAVSEKITGFEALLRWNHPQLGLVPPSQFIPIAERSGMILPIGNWILLNACRQNKKWQDAGYPPVRMAVNISIYQLQNQDLLELLKAILSETGLGCEYLELEITESIAMSKTDKLIEKLDALKALGIKMSIDDFGTEYSSLSRLKLLPVDRVKIDMYFVQGIGVNDKDEAIVRTIITLAKNLGLQTIAEGVESQQQFEFLSRNMCDEIQGYYYYKPLAGNEIEALLESDGEGIELKTVFNYNS
ncbi:MAG: EAL domain-containing protein [Proteocatella sp.]